MRQLAHALPLTPQLALVPGLVQLFALQQPPGQPVASQTQLLATQCLPAPHCADEPHWQTPGAAQLSARTGSQAAQEAPLVPHFETSLLKQLPALQHPSGQLAELQPLQAWLKQVCPGHAVQAPPPFPQTVIEVPGWQMDEPSQQPVGQLVTSQTQAPDWHR